MEQLNPSPTLYQAIIRRIDYEKKINELKQKLLTSSVILAVSLYVFKILLMDFFRQLASSGFLQFAGLFRSDSTILIHHFSDYLLSLAESLPAMSFGFVSIMVLVLLASSIKLCQYALELKQLKRV